MSQRYEARQPGDPKRGGVDTDDAEAAQGQQQPRTDLIGFVAAMGPAVPIQGQFNDATREEWLSQSVT